MPAPIRDLAPADEAAFRRLFAGYAAFYEAAVDEATVSATLARILDPAAPMLCRIAEAEGAVAGFAVCVLHEGTFETHPVAYLEDLYVDPARRGAGLGRALIEDLLALGRARGWSRLYWHTRAGNAAARRLYDRFAEADDFVRYMVRFR